MKRISAVIVSSLIIVGAVAIVTSKVSASQAKVYNTCDVSALVNLTGKVIGEQGNVVGGSSFLCTTNNFICKGQQETFESMQRDELRVNLYQLYKACKATGY